MLELWEKEDIRNLLQRSDKAVRRGLLCLYYLQTADEQNDAVTNSRNGVGFNSYDAKFLTSLAKFLIVNGYLTPKQIKYARDRLLKYAGQLAKIANGEVTVDVYYGNYDGK